jgi:hypothetical protein
MNFYELVSQDLANCFDRGISLRNRKLEAVLEIVLSLINFSTFAASNSRK